MVQWTEAAPGVWKATIGSPQELSPLRFIGAAPKLEAMEKLPQPAIPWDWSELTCASQGQRWVLTLPLGKEEKLYGMGLQFMRMNQRGRTRYLRVNSDPKQDTGETHAPVPFYVSDVGYGVFVDTSRIVTIHGGSTILEADTRLEGVKDRNTDPGWKATPVSSRVEIVFPDSADVYVLLGPTVLDVVRRYNLFCGGGVLPPKWGLGFWHRVPKMFTAEETAEEAAEYRKRNFPCDVIGLEPGWHSKSYPVTYEWAEERFPDPQRFLQEMQANGFHVNLWEHPYVSPDSRLYASLKSFSGSHTVWGGLAPDYSLPEARELYKEQHRKEHVELGVSGYKLDECDGSELTNHAWMFPAHARFPSGYDGEQMRQLYGLMAQKMTDELYREENRRTYGLARASGGAAASLPYVLYSDLYDHKQFVRALCNASFSGLLWTPEVRKASNAEDWIRRMQAVCFSPLAMLNAWGDGTKPWSYPEAEPIVRHYIKLRMRLLPYLYTVFAQYREEGIPPFRAMPLVMSADEIQRSMTRSTEAATDFLNTTDGAYGHRKQQEWDDQFMMGDSILVAPLFAGEAEREVLLPEGAWYGLETGVRYEGSQVVTVRCGVEIMPIFVREGAVIPVMADFPHVPSSGEQIELELVHFGNVAGEARLYDDDGESFDYERGTCGWWRAEVKKETNGVWKGEWSPQGSDRQELFSYDTLQWRFAQTRL